MEWLNRMMQALEYIEDHLEEHIDIMEVSKVACSSSFHFQRLFHMITGTTVAEYIRNRRLTLAAQELVSGQLKVIDVALKFGYETPESFSKAFRKLHGVTPTQARKPGTALRAYPKISFQLSLKGEKEMNYRIVEKESFTVAGKALEVDTRDGNNFKMIPPFWKENRQNGTCQKLCGMGLNNGLLGVCVDMDHEKEKFVYMIGTEVSKETGAPGLVKREIPAATWAVFTSVGPMPGAIQDVWNRIFQEWFPSTNYEHAGIAELEVYPPGDPSAEDYQCEVWVAVVKK